MKVSYYTELDLKKIEEEEGENDIKKEVLKEKMESNQGPIV